MFVFELLNSDYKPLRITDPVSLAVSVMEDSSLHHYPIVDEPTGKLIGEASYEQLRTVADTAHNNINSGLGADGLIRDTDHILNACRTMLQLNRTMLPVVDRQGNYKGILTKPALMEAVVRILNLRDQGTVIMIEMDPRDYMLSDVIRIIEAEGARILSLTIQSPDASNERFRVSVKLNLDDLARVGNALRRYGYLITSESNTEMTDAELSDKADEFLRYLSM